MKRGGRKGDREELQLKWMRVLKTGQWYGKNQQASSDTFLLNSTVSHHSLVKAAQSASGSKTWRGRLSKVTRMWRILCPRDVVYPQQTIELEKPHCLVWVLRLSSSSVWNGYKEGDTGGTETRGWRASSDCDLGDSSVNIVVGLHWMQLLVGGLIIIVNFYFEAESHYAVQSDCKPHHLPASAFPMQGL